jgi:hypothetical protein
VVKRTLWGHLKEKAKGAVEYRHANPLKVKVGGTFTFESVGYTQRAFTTESIREATRTLMGDEFTFTDYDLNHGVRLRCNDDSILLLEKAADFGYDEDFDKNVLRGQGTIDFEDETYWRVNDVLTSFEAKTLTVADKNGDGKVDPEEISHNEIEYWDFWRKEESGRLYFLFVEMEKATGYFTVWTGFETHKNLISY